MQIFIFQYRKNRGRIQNCLSSVGNIYNRPYTTVDNFDLFLNEFTSFIDMNYMKHKGIFLAGDYNTDLLNLPSNNKFNDYFNSIISHGFLPSVALPTRIHTWFITYSH